MIDVKTILLVEDNPDDEEFTLRALRRAKVSNPVQVVRDGAEALDWFFGSGGHEARGASELPAVVLLDLNLPKVSGLDVLKRIRANEATKHVPVVVLTSSSEDEDIIGSYASGANSYVRKPVGFAEFATAVGQLGVYWTLVNQPPKRA